MCYARKQWDNIIKERERKLRSFYPNKLTSRYKEFPPAVVIVPDLRKCWSLEFLLRNLENGLQATAMTREALAPEDALL